MRHIAFGILSFMLLAGPAMAADAPAPEPKPRPATAEELQKEVDSLTQQVQYWQGVAQAIQADRNAALDAKADALGKLNIKPATPVATSAGK